MKIRSLSFIFPLLFVIMFCGDAFAQGFVRLTITGNSVVLRPMPDATGEVFVKADAGEVFIAEKRHILNEGDKARWYRLVFAVDAASGTIMELPDKDSRFKAAHYPFVMAKYVRTAPLKKGDEEQILQTSFGKGAASGLGINFPDIVRKHGGGDNDFAQRTFQAPGEYPIVSIYASHGVYLVARETSGDRPFDMVFANISLFKKGVEHDGLVIGDPKSDKNAALAQAKKDFPNGAPDPETGKTAEGEEFWRYRGPHCVDLFVFDADGTIVRYDYALGR